jgi:CBS domain-containing protein
MGSSAIVDRITALLKRAAPFDRLRPEERHQLLCEVLVEYFEPDEVILDQGRTAHEFLYIVESGFVRLLDPQTQRLVGECGEGRVFGGHGLVEGGALPYEARTVKPTVCVLLRARRFRELYSAHKGFAAFFDSDLSRYHARQLPLDVSSARLLFGTRLGDLVHRRPVVCGPDATAREAATIMRRESVDSAVGELEEGVGPAVEAFVERAAEGVESIGRFHDATIMHPPRAFRILCHQRS